MSALIINFQQAKDLRVTVYVNGLKGTKVYHIDPECPRLNEANLVAEVNLSELKELHPNVRVCSFCKG